MHSTGSLSLQAESRTSHTVLTFLLLSLLLPGVSLFAQSKQFEVQASWTGAIEPFAISDNLYYIGSQELTSYLITTDAGHIVIDAPLEQNVDMQLANIRKLGFDPQDVHLVIASHGHFDHTGGLAKLLEATGAVLVLSEADAELVENGGKGDFFLGDRAAYPPATATRTLEHLETVSLGGVTLTAHLTPGHTRGCTSWSGETTIDGDPVSFLSVCSLTVLQGYQLVDQPSYPGIARDFCASVRHLERQAVDLFLASHASFIGLAQKVERLAQGDKRAFVDPEGYQAYLKLARERIEKTLAEQGQSGGCSAVLDN
jgi:metallo-beta-lactamase class B